MITSRLQTIVRTEIAADTAICAKCKEEILDPFSRWYRYPFTNCNDCGPRLSIARAVPYTRRNTSMATFTRCADCVSDAEDIENRRCNLQAIACHKCGPVAWLEAADGQAIAASQFSILDDINAVSTLLQNGEIVAIKGLGSFYLAGDATNETVVQKLRDRKQCYRQPFALMARDVEMVEKYCTPTDKERELLKSPAAPIVLMSARGKKQIAPSVAPAQNTLGFMLAYTPLQHLIFQSLKGPIVITSGNLSGEVPCIDNEEAKVKLKGITNYFLLHNLPIVNRVDDSVVRQVGEEMQILRRARGYAPTAISLPFGFSAAPEIVAMGGELKSTFCLLKNGQAILSPHLGDLNNAATSSVYRESLNQYSNLFECKPEAIAIDWNLDYFSTKLGQEIAAANRLKLYSIQPHHAHVAACMAENGLPLDSPAVLGIVLDGLGYSENGTIWGGEFILADYRNYKRLATFKPVAALGGEEGIFQAWHNTYAHLMAAFTWEELQRDWGDLELIKFLTKKRPKLLKDLERKEINYPLISSCVQLFDAVAAAIGLCREKGIDAGQSSIELEAIVKLELLEYAERKLAYPFAIGNTETFVDNSRSKIKSAPLPYIEPYPMWKALLKDLRQNMPKSAIAAKFHKGLANAIADMVIYLCRQENAIERVVLTGSVFHNRLFLEQILRRLDALQLNVFTPSSVPPNEAALSLGQAVITAAKLMNR